MQLPCGCELLVDAENVLHIHPCRDDCPAVEALRQEAARLYPQTPLVDLRPAEEVLGRQLSNQEVTEALRLLKERS